jgi:hypothetical protein
VEIAIVLVIIGLIIGGIMAGADMIKQAEMRALMKQIDSFNAATNTFIGKYSLPTGRLPVCHDVFSCRPSLPA